MSANSKIEWTDTTWNPVRGCSRVSEGCRFCYAERIAARGLPGLNSPTTGEPFATMTDHGPRWTGKVELIEDKLTGPLRWRKPRRVFVNSMSDLFHEALPDEDIYRVFSVMRRCPRHSFQVLTKRPTNMLRVMREVGEAVASGHAEGPWPLPNVWLGVSVEDQKTADERIPLLLQTPAAVRFISAEPLLGAVSLPVCCGLLCGLDWIIVGGESGRNARPMHPDWARSLRDQCRMAGVPFFFKQWGEWAPDPCSQAARNEGIYSPPQGMLRVGKKAAGRMLDGREWNEFPEVPHDHR